MYIRRDIMRAVLGVFLLFSLAGCGARGAAGDEEVAAQEGRREPRLPEVMQVLLGTFQLEDTEYAVGREQAAELLPLWKAYRTLLNSASASPQETEALAGQIVDTMSAEQMSAINDMELGQGALMTLMEEQGLTMGRQGDKESDEASGQGGMPGGFGGGPGGDMGDMGGMGGGGGTGGGVPGRMVGGGEVPDDLPADVAEGRPGGGMMVSPDLVEAVIELLESKV